MSQGRRAQSRAAGLGARGLRSVGLVGFVGLFGLGSCAEGLEPAPLDQLLLPTGLAESPDGRWLFVTNGNWDRRYAESAVLVLDLEAVAGGLADPRLPGAQLDAAGPCRLGADGDRVECDPRLLITEEGGVRIPGGAGNVAVDQPDGPDGKLRLLIPTRLDPTVMWIDVFAPGYAGAGEVPVLECGQGAGRRCDADHRVAEIFDDPARLSLDTQGYRYAYLPQLLGGRLSLLTLDGERGPEVVDVEEAFFREDGLFDSGLAGGFDVVQRACDVETNNAPLSSDECTRPFLYASSRYWWGLRNFRVAPGLDVVINGAELPVIGPNLEGADPRPLLAGIAFEDPERGESLLAVHTTPPGLSRIDTSLDPDDGEPIFDVTDTVSICSNPNVLAVHRPEQGSRLAFVSCYGSEEVAVVDLFTFVVVDVLAVGAGPNELLIDPVHSWLLVANTLESSISVIDLDQGSPTYLREVATLGLHTQRGTP